MEHSRPLTAFRTFGFDKGRVSALILVLLCGLQTGCATQSTTAIVLQSVAREQQGTPPTYVGVAGEEAARAIAVTRAARQVAVTVPMVLEPGDEIRVGPSHIATITFPAGHEATLMPDTRARLGSILDLVGRLFVSARGYFRVETEYVTAGVKGTEFWVQVTPDQTASAGVIDGSITVASRTGRWEPVDVAKDEVVTMRRDQPPTKELKQRAEVDAIWQTVRRLRTFPPVVPRLPAPR